MVPAKAPDRPANGTIIPHAVDASVDDMQPYLQVRVVQNLQAQTAKGSTRALKAQRKLIINLNQHFLELPAGFGRTNRMHAQPSFICSRVGTLRWAIGCYHSTRHQPLILRS